MDDQDTVQAYEEKGKASGENGQPSSRYEQGLKALSSLDRIKQVEAIEGRKFTLLFWLFQAFCTTHPPQQIIMQLPKVPFTSSLV